MDEAKIASRIVADYGDVAIYLNIFDIFDTNVKDFGENQLGTVRRELTPAAIQMLKNKVSDAALEATKLLKADVIAKLKHDNDLLEDMHDLGIRFKR